MSPADQAKTDSLEKRLTWLDEQRRKDAELLRKLTSQSRAAEDLVGKQARQLQDLSTELARLGAMASRLQGLDETLSKHRQEVSRQLESADARRTEREKSGEQQRRKDRDDLARRIAEIQQELTVLEELRRGFEASREEAIRVARSVAGQGERIDDLALAVQAQIQEASEHHDQHQQEARRSTDLQGQVNDLRHRLEAARVSLEAVEDRARQLEIRAAELEAGERERQETTAQWMESQQLRMADLERVWGEYARRFETFEKRAVEIQERIYVYEDTHRAQRQLQTDLEKTLERLEGRIGEIGEMHRLNEDRRKQEWTAFQAEDHQRWSHFKLNAEEQQQENARAHQRLTEELSRLEEAALQALQGSIALEDSVQRRWLEMLALLREWVGEADRQPPRVR